MRNRLLSNIFALTVCVAGFFGVTFALNFLSSNEIDVDHEHSFERRSADRLYDERKFESAARYYKQLLVTDPNNGGAAMAYADCLSRQRIGFLREILQEYRTESPDQALIEKATEEANASAETIIPAYEALLRFPRHKDGASFALARMHALRGEKRKAIDYLLAATDNGYRPRHRISRYLEFQSILEEPEIREHGNF